MGNLLLKELRLRYTGSGYIWFALTTVVLIVVPFVLGVLEYAHKKENYNLLAPVYENEVIVSEHRYRSVYEHASFALNGVHRAVAPPVLQAAIRGTEKFRNTIFSLAVNPWAQSRFPFMKTERYYNPVDDFLPPLDLGMVTTFLLSILVMVFAYNTVSQEREDGTLRLMLANAVSRAHILFAKLCGGYAAVILPVLFAYLTCLLVVQFMPSYALGMADLAAFSGIFLFMCLYLLVIYSLGVLVSTIFKRSSTAIAVLVLIWLGYIILFHNGMLLYLRYASQSESLYTIVKQAEHPEWTQTDLDFWCRQIYGKWLRDLPAEQQMDAYRMLSDRQERFMMPVLERHIRQVEHDAGVVGRLRFLSPSLLFTSSATALAGTGLERYAALMREVYRYLDYFRENALVQMKIDAADMEKRRNYGRYYALAQGKRPPLIRTEYRPFKPRPVPVHARIAGTLWSAFALFCYAVIFFMAAFYAFIKTEIT